MKKFVSALILKKTFIYWGKTKKEEV